MSVVFTYNAGVEEQCPENPRYNEGLLYLPSGVDLEGLSNVIGSLRIAGNLGYIRTSTSRIKV
jgi:hypothetical protein